jgi:signal transduction histidine kinase
MAAVTALHAGEWGVHDPTAWASELGVYEWDMSADRVRWLNDWCRHFDIDPCDGPDHGVRWREYVHPDDRAAALREYEAHMAGERDRYETEYRIRTLCGNWRWIRNRGRCVRGARPSDPVRMVGICVDVDERKRLEVELDQSRRRLEALADASPCLMLLLDPDGNIAFANRPISGVVPADLIGKPLTAMLPAGVDRELIDAFRRAVVDSRAPQMRTVVLGDGRTFGTWATPLVEGNRVTSIASVSVDLSERRTRERDLLEAVTREQRRFAHDLHDGLGQELTGIALLVKSLLQRAGGDSPALRDGLAEVLNYVNGAIATSRDVARGASPVGREHGGLTRALGEISRHWPDTIGITIECRLPPPGDDELEPLLAENLYRIAQEAVSNAIRHSGATQVLLSFERRGAGLRLVIDDDGCGMTANEALDGAGLGLHIMRARAELIGALLRVGGRTPHGTRIECVRNWKAARAAAPRS